MSEMRKIDVVSMHLPQLVLGGHRISLQMRETTPSDMVGTLRVYPGAGGCNVWADCAHLERPDEHDASATRTRLYDESGYRRILWRLDVTGLAGAAVNLIEYPGANLWYLTVNSEDAATAVVPLFDARLFAFDPSSLLVMRYGVPIREIARRGDAEEMRAEAELVRRALAELDARPATRGAANTITGCSRRGWRVAA